MPSDNLKTLESLQIGLDLFRLRDGAVEGSDADILKSFFEKLEADPSEGPQSGKSWHDRTLKDGTLSWFQFLATIETQALAKHLSTRPLKNWVAAASSGKRPIDIRKSQPEIDSLILQSC